MSEQAIETEEVIETDAGIVIEDTDEGEVAEVEAQAEPQPEPEPEEVEIIVEGEEEPTSKPVRESGFYKRVRKLTGQRDEARSEVEVLKAEAEAAREEAAMWRTQAQQPTLKKPRAEDFETDAEFDAALEKYDEQRIAKAAREQAEALLRETQTQNTQAQQNQNLESQFRAHYDRAAGLKVDDYAATEDAAMDMLGDDLTKTIMANTDKSEILMYHLGKNPVKAERLHRMSVENPVACVLEIGRLENSLRVRPKHSPAPNPDPGVGGAPVEDFRGPAGATFE